MKNKATFLIILIGLILGGISYWFQPYSELYFRESKIIWIMWSAGAFLGALLMMRIFVKEKPWRIALLITAGFVLAVLGRIVFDVVFIDPTHHNLAPFELAYCGWITLPFSLAGAYLSILIRKLNK